ncbi:polysaccharide deacetylase family protein [Suttonella sp. R2A3]|uniref:polysaccharide deacetylase family protein n=1 Tax=Suttonella sp. R2A3 TaxID=2908648 RepID=UPI001F2340DF|nr:polysaccharide deacetylase family protein [Suttonella sp. R2A3]UJF25316.1 polysaccharide deacetylase family protein [Suttonella sp. R2A3]
MPYFSAQVLNWLSLILKERFGQSFTLTQPQNSLKLTLVNSEQGHILFPKLEDAFHQSSSDFPCAYWEATKEGWVSVLGQPLVAPCVHELPVQLIEYQADHAVIHYDILGLTYWMLNRIEEIGRKDLDNHERFPAIHSHAYKYDYLERPIVDEWLYVLGQVIEKVWPNIKLKQHQFSMKVSHDVDSPSLYQFKSWKTIIRMMGGHLLKRHDLKSFFQSPYIKVTAGSRLHNQDPHNTFDWLMDVSEVNNLTSAFYFICGRTSELDADYEPENQAIKNLIKKMHERGHEIGLHPSYNTYQTPELIKQEADQLRQVLQEEGIEQPMLGGRMHYLRWQHPTTLQAWNDAGMTYDTTLSYADRPGFRCGTCFEYPAFNPTTQQQLDIRVRPLIAMECTVIAERYMNLGCTQEAIAKFLELKNKCQKVSGCFTLLWHNSHFNSNEDKQIYQKIIES